MLSGCRKSALFLYFLLLLDGIFLHCHAGGLCQHYQFVVKEAPYTRLYKTKKILTVNGQFVGPTLHVHKGDEIVVGVYNRGNHNITLHWHGVKQPRCPWLDGPEYITQCPIKPGAKFSQKVIFTAEEGTIWWHAHSDCSRATVHGAIVVYPKYDTCYPFPKPSAEVPIILELTRIGKATTSTDVFAFGAFILEVACGRRPIQPQRSPKGVVLVDWVFENWKEGAILQTSDPRLGGDYLEEEMELVLKLGLLCSGSNAATRPSMRQVMQYLDGDVLLPEISHVAASIGIESSSELVMSFPPLVTKSSDHSMSCTESIFNSGR
ncbi:hypothetical protein Vadar_012311 [Vaccinium darrowii]|uniref:Uncharacterized protein n=1 Tax=Vaccinium darrowii TaxID=229202 RepID=A0ACB7ZB69_9ERIC|nr:hypothetical protein Vadar_012311 [Vaccinium darrowii]